jgi:hypothetical protein
MIAPVEGGVMPQIWLSVQELADFLGCSAPAAAEHVSAQHWARRRCSDGLKRVKLPLPEMERFLQDNALIRGQTSQTDLLVTALQSVLHAAKSGPSGQAGDLLTTTYASGEDRSRAFGTQCF